LKFETERQGQQWLCLYVHQNRGLKEVKMAEKDIEVSKPLSEYNLFTSRHGQMGFSIAESAQLWNLMKEGKYDEGRDDPWAILTGTIGEVEEDITSASISFEKDLEEHITKNLNQIEKGISLYKKGKKSGRQFKIDFGIIDLLTKDKRGDFLVIELKVGKATYAVIGQVLSYMGWVRQNLAKDKKVRGIIIADDFHEKVKFAAQEIPNLILKQYEVSFSFNDI